MSGYISGDEVSVLILRAKKEIIAKQIPKETKS